MSEYNKVQVTKELLEGASSYIPLKDKQSFVDFVADKCFDRMELQADGESGIPNALPPMYKENYATKSRFLMGALANLYLKLPVELESEIPWFISVESYDTFSGSHIFNQLERAKGQHGELRDKVFDLLADFRILEKMLNTEIYGLLSVMNDSVSRLQSTIEMQSSPMMLDALKEQLDSVKSEFEQYSEGKKKAPNPPKAGKKSKG